MGPFSLPPFTSQTPSIEEHYDNQGSRGRYTVVYYESIKLELNRRLIYECRCDERLKVKAEGSTRLTYTGLCGGLEHLKIEMRLINEMFVSVMGECVILTPQVHRQYSK